MNTPERPEDRPKDRLENGPEVEPNKPALPGDSLSPSRPPEAERPAASSAKPAQTTSVGPMPGPTRPAPPSATKPGRFDEPNKPVKSAKPPREPRHPRRGGIALAVLLALLALAAAAYVGWQQWQQQRADRASAQSTAALQHRVDTLDETVQKLGAERDALSQRVSHSDDASRSLQASLNGQSERLRGLEGAVARLSQQTLSGHDVMLLDETDALLRMGGERYRLFHDAQGAAAAYAAAGQALDAVNDEAFAGIRESVKQEREALLKSRTANQQAALAQLDLLRSSVADWPLRPLDTPSSPEAAEGGFWSRIGHALASVVSIERDSGAPLAVADARLARELAGLDLAQAQAALLAHDPDGYPSALKRVDASLAQQFDPSAPAVREARAALADLISKAQPVAPVALGGALEQLRNLRAVHALAPTSSASAPAPASSAAPSVAPVKTGTESAPSRPANGAAAGSTPAEASSAPAAPGSPGAMP